MTTPEFTDRRRNTHPDVPIPISDQEFRSARIDVKGGLPKTQTQITTELKQFKINLIEQCEYCEYKIFNSTILKMNETRTNAQNKGEDNHNILYNEFNENSNKAKLSEAIATSKSQNLRSRELKVKSLEYGIYGRIDEVKFAPNGFVIIDDTTGMKAYPGKQNQVFAYCLAFQTTISQYKDPRPIIAVIRNSETKQILWQSEFDIINKYDTIMLITHIHDLLTGKVQCIPTKNQNKCTNCSYSDYCTKSLI